MPLLALLAVLLIAGVMWQRRSRGDTDTDTPQRIVTTAMHLMPPPRRDWGQAMIAELAQITRPADRWRFTAGVVRVVVFPPPPRPRRVLAVAITGALVVAAATATAARQVPGIAVFVAVFGLLVCGYATVAVARSQRPQRGLPHVIVAVTAVAGLSATITVVAVSVAHPAATVDHTHHVVTILFALILTGYLALATSPSRLSGNTDAALWWALGAALAGAAVWTVLALTTPLGSEGVAGFLEPVGAAVTLTAAIGATATTRSRRAGVKAGLLAIVLAAPMHFAIDLSVLLYLHQYTLTNSYDIAALPHSGYPDTASYLLSDALDGNILAGLLLNPLTLAALALLGAITATGIHDLPPDVPHTPSPDRG